MESNYYRVLHEIQERHWWYVARRRILSAVIEQLFKAGLPDGVLYDLGCGVGANLPLLERFGRTQGVDSAPEAIAFDPHQVSAGLQVAHTHRSHAHLSPVDENASARAVGRHREGALVNGGLNQRRHRRFC